MYKGKLTSWIDEKGYGFIESEGLSKDTFTHISTLKAMSRKPKVGDFIYFDVEQQPNGKTRAINCRIEGVAAKNLKRNQPRVTKNSSSPKFVVILSLLAVGVFIYHRANIQVPAISAAKKQLPEVKSHRSVNTFKSSPRFSCDGRQHCSQMSSYEEAKYFIQNCPNTKMDGDNDGIPCERLFNHF